MITFYAGNTLGGITDRILQSLHPKEGGNHIVLVPDRNTLSREEAVLRAVGGSLLNVEVLTFARFAIRVMGKEAEQCLTPEACTVLLAKALLKCKQDLSYYRNAVDTDGFVNEMYSSLVAVRNSGIGVDELKQAAERMQGRAREKTRDLAVIYNAYLAELQLPDPTSRLEGLCRAIPDSMLVAQSDVYVIDFFAFNPIQFRVLAALMRYAKNLHIGYIAQEVGEDNRRIYPHGLRNTLLAIAKREGVFCQTVSVPTVLTPYKQQLQNKLFSFGDGYDVPDDVKAQAKQAVRLFFTPDVVGQMRTVCAEILRLMRAGYRYRDIAIVCPDPEAYWDVLHNVFAEYGIPLFADRQAILNNEPIVRLLRGLIEIEQTNEIDAVMRVVKNPLFAVEQSKAFAFENFCKRYGIRYAHLQKPFVAYEQDPDRDAADEIRNSLLDMLPDFSHCATCKDYVEVLRDILRREDINRTFAAFVDQQRNSGFEKAAAVSERVSERLMDLLSTLTRLVGDLEIDRAGFLHLLTAACCSVKIRLLPQSADCVYIGDALESHYVDTKVMFVVGADEGNLPRDPASGSILCETYYRSLLGQNIELKPSNKEQWLAARFYLEQILLVPDHLYVSYAQRSTDNKATTPSGLILALSELFDLPVENGLGHNVVCQIGTRSNAYKVLLRNENLQEAAREEILSALTDGEKRRLATLQYDSVQTLPNAKELFFQEELTSISQLEKYFACPYAHFVRYGLRAQEPKEGDPDKAEIGTLLHRVMELFLRRHTQELDDMSQERMDALIAECVDEAVSESRFAMGDHTTEYNRLLQECTTILRLETQLIRRSNFKPTEFEVTFGKPKRNKPGGEGARPDYPPIELGDIRLYGKIDRIDRCGDLVSVIDYKSGTGHYQLKYVYYGTKIQLYAYMTALQKAGLIPVGGFYKLLSGAFRKSGDNLFAGCLLGQIPVDKTEWINLLDPTLAEGKDSEILPIVLKHGVYCTKQKQMAVTYEQLQNIMQYVIDLMKQAVCEIADGYIVPSPIDEACKYCPAYAMCPMGKQTPQRTATTPSVDSFLTSEAEE